MKRIRTAVMMGLIGLGLIPGCGGSGESCHFCGGRGAVRCIVCDGDGRSFGTRVRCPVCEGSGKQTCVSCGGSGHEEGRRFSGATSTMPDGASSSVGEMALTPQPPTEATAGDPTIRYRNIPDLIRRYEAQIAELQRENEHLDQVMVSYERAPDYRLSSSEVDYRGRRVMMLSHQKYGNQKLVSDLERRIQDLRREHEQLRRGHDFE